MNSDRYREVMRVVDAALDCEPARRDPVLAAACRGDAGLRAEVERLLAQNTAANTFLGESPFEVLPELQAETAAVGKRIGPYRVVEQIGRGGMGAVYRAVRDDEQYETQVAVKVIKRGMDSEAILRRFRQERQILANLSHPNVARMLDGGTTEEGLPFFVMEYVEGRPIARYCDEKKLTTSDRLRLFRTVCTAVSYAHRNLVVHRDLKPSNILVTPEGEVKLLDFGIAKLLHARPDAAPTAATATELRAMTPEYASPEQVRGEPITTASDVYSLGVLLYELLTGHRPYHFKSRRADEMARVISEVEPERPSMAVSRVETDDTAAADSTAAVTPESVSRTRDGEPERLRRRLRGDLDNIVLTALRKEPARRYATVEQFSEDIRRHLEGLTVAARKDTFSYRAQKFVRRNRVGVVAASLVALALVGGMAMTLWQARVARAERAKAERRFNEVRRLAHLFMFDYHDAIAALPNSTPVRQRLVKDALEYLDRLAQEAGDDRALQRELAMAYLKMGSIQGGSAQARSGAIISAANLGDRAGAVESFRKAQAMLERLVAVEPGNAETREQLAESYAQFSDLMQSWGNDPAESHQYLRKSATIYEELLAADPSNKRLLSKLSLVYDATGQTLYVSNQAHLGDLPGAIAYLRRALEINRRLSELEPANAEYRQVLAANYANLGAALSQNGNYEEALDNQRKAAAVTEALAGEFGTNLLYKRELAVQYGNIGKTLLATGDKGGALENFIQARDLIDSVSAADPANADYRRLTATAAGNLADGLAAKGDRAGALENYEKAYQILTELLAKDEKNLRVKMQLGAVDLKVSTFLSNGGDAAGAAARARRAVEMVEPLAAANPNNSNARQTLASAYAQLGRCDATLAADARTPAGDRRGRWQEAADWYRKSVQSWEVLKAKGSLTGVDVGKFDEAARELARCEAELKK